MPSCSFSVAQLKSHPALCKLDCNAHLFDDLDCIRNIGSFGSIGLLCGWNFGSVRSVILLPELLTSGNETHASVTVLQVQPRPVMCAQHLVSGSLMFAQGTARPSGRSGHGMALTRLQDNKTGLVVFGGRSKGDLLHNDTWALELPGFQDSAA